MAYGCTVCCHSGPRPPGAPKAKKAGTAKYHAETDASPNRRQAVRFKPEHRSTSTKNNILRNNKVFFGYLLWFFGSLCGFQKRDLATHAKRGISPSWLPECTGAQGCQGRHRRGVAGALTALWHSATSPPLFCASLIMPETVAMAGLRQICHPHILPKSHKNRTILV